MTVLTISVSLVFVNEAPAPPILPNVCSVSTSGLVFGVYTPRQVTPLDAVTYASIVCTAGTAFLLGLDNGIYYQDSWRRSRNGSQYINYQLYLDNSRSQVWGMTPGVNMLSGFGTGAQQNIPVYGRIPALQEPTDGSYGDTITVTVEYMP